MTKVMTFLTCVLLLSACSEEDLVFKNTDVITTQYTEKLPKKQTPIYIKIFNEEEQLLSKQITVISPNITLLEALNLAVPDMTVTHDDADISRRINVKFVEQTLDSYLQYLSELTGYQISLDNNVIHIDSMTKRTWNLSALSMTPTTFDSSASSEVSTDGSNTDQSQTIVDEQGQWDDIIEHLETVIDEEGKVFDNQKLGTITVVSSPRKISVVSDWMNNLVIQSNKQIHLRVEVLDITVDESVGYGVDWDLLADNGNFNLSNAGAQTTIDDAGVLSIGSGADAFWEIGDNISLDIMLNFLRSQGKVTVQNHPNVTVTNGNAAFISTGDEFSYVAEIEGTTDDNGNFYTTSEIERMSVGVDLSVTPKVLDDERIALNIVPVISSLKSYTEFTSGTDDNLQTFQTPNIALQKLSTQVIVKSGATVHLGGLIAEKLTDAAKGLADESNFFNFLFRGVEKTLERREIVILVTPTLVG